MFAKTTIQADRLQAPERNGRLPKLALRRRAGHSSAMLALLATAAISTMALTPAAGPAFAAFNVPAPAVQARTTVKTARLPVSPVDLACKGQTWGAETADCVIAIAERSGRPDRAVRMIAGAGPQANMPNAF